MDDNRVGLHLSFYPKARGLLSSTFNRFALLAPASKSILKSCKSPAWLAWLQVELASWLGKKFPKKRRWHVFDPKHSASCWFCLPYLGQSCLSQHISAVWVLQNRSISKAKRLRVVTMWRKGKQQVQNITKPSGDNSLYRLLLKQDESFLLWSV